jgi:IS6 family transposase
MAERRITVDTVTIYRWASASRPSSSRRPGPPGVLSVNGGSPTRLMSKPLAGGHTCRVIDVLLSAQRDLAAARRFFTYALRSGTVSAEVTTDRARPIHVSWTS